MATLQLIICSVNMAKKLQLNETEIRHDISLLREISKSTSGTSNVREDKSGEDEDFAYDSSGGKNDIPEENTPKNNHIFDEDFKPGRYDKRNVRSSTKIQSFRKYGKQKNLYRTNYRPDDEGSTVGNEVELSESNNANNTSMTSNGNNNITTSTNNGNGNNNTNNTTNTTNKDTNTNNINKRQLRSRKKLE